MLPAKNGELCAFRERQSQRDLPASSGRNACADTDTRDQYLEENSQLLIQKSCN